MITMLKQVQFTECFTMLKMWIIELYAALNVVYAENMDY